MLISLAVTSLIMSPSASQAQTEDVTTAWIQATGSGEQGQGILLNGQRGCLLFTAGHVLGDAETVSVRINGGQTEQGNVRAFFGESSGADFGVVELQNRPRVACPNVPPPSAIAAALRRSGDGEIIRVDEAGERRRIQVRIVQDIPRLVVRPLFPDDSEQKGTSGAPLVVSGVVVGIATAVRMQGSAPLISIERLDALPADAQVWAQAVHELANDERLPRAITAPAPIPAVILGSWRGESQCSLGVDEVSWNISKTGDGRVLVEETYQSRFRQAHVAYEGTWNGRALSLTSASLTHYRVVVQLSADAHTLSGRYYEHADCMEIKLSK